MEFCGYGTLSAPVRAQIERVADIWKVHLQAQLVGLYLHGSLALGRFAEGVSDLDLLAVAGRRMPRAERLAVASDMLDADRRPCPLEMSALYIGDLEPWRHPTLCQFHYSDYWAETYRQLLDGRMRGCFLYPRPSRRRGVPAGPRNGFLGFHQQGNRGNRPLRLFAAADCCRHSQSRSGLVVW